MQPDEEQKVVPTHPPLATKLAIMLGLMPRECTEIALMIKENSKCLSEAMLPLEMIE